MDVDVAVVGGGFAGLFTAAELTHRGVGDLVVVERSSHPGGVARTLREEGHLLEPGAGTLMLPHPHLSPLLARTEFDARPANGAALRYVHTGGRLVPVSRSPRMLLAPLVGWRARLRGGLEPLVSSRARSDDESLADLLERRFGRELGGLIASLAASGVYAGDPRRLSARSAFPALGGFSKQGGSLILGGIRAMRRRDRASPRPSAHVPVPDFAAFADALAASLGDRFRPGFETASVASDGAGFVVDGSESLRARHVVLACPPTAAAALLEGEVSHALRRGVAAPVAVAWIGGEGSEVPLPKGFGALIGPDAGLRVVGILFESSYAPHRAPQGRTLAKVILGGARHPDVATWDDDHIVETVVDEASAVLGTALAPSFRRVVRHLEGIPQYEVGHDTWLSTVESLLPASMHVTGWAYRGVGVAHLAADAARVAERIAPA